MTEEMMETLNQMLARNIAILPDRNFLIFEDRGISYAEFGQQTARMAQVMAAQGLGKGDRIGLYLPSVPLMAVAVFACQRLGAVPLPLSAMFRQDELRRVVQASGMKAIIADAMTFAEFAPIRAEFPALGQCFVTGGAQTDALDLDALMALAPDRFDDAPNQMGDVAALFFSSGTTGAPKGILQSHLNHCSILRDMMVAHGSRYGQEVYLCAVPLFTNFGLTATLNLCMYTGGTLILHERWNTDKVLTDIAHYGATYFGGTPTMYVYMVNDYDTTRHNLSSLRVCTTGGSPVPQPVIRRFEEISGVKVAQVYGATETCGQNVIEPVTGLRRSGAAGLPIGSSRILIVDEAGELMPQGEIGEVIIGGDSVALGYLDDPAATAAAFGPLGWKSGDLGYLDEDGFLFIVDRKKDVIITGGHNIFPLEVESTLYEHPAVAVCAVVGGPDVAKGEIPVAIIVKTQGVSVTAEEIQRYCRERLSAYKVPRQVEFIDEMPVEAAKIRKRDLVAALRDDTLDKFRRQSVSP
ncbi:class I adenylate-forming enzyme family protein [Pseudorhodobacter sp.]|uniref:class I adenylate-forming enzyme family protein n=1 Tax=Pseudorhodobacter sp. TaxID=1934400 RepID=UPI002AFFD424|nr:AMP-binding protein [Pseudorhodobacter sp.]